MKKISLNGKWNMLLKSANRNYEADVPCSDYSAMLNCGAIPDPFYATNEKDCLFISESDKTFEKNFVLENEDLDNEKIILSCKMLDTLCNVFVNDILVGKGENAYIGYEFDIKKAVKIGENNIRIEFYSPVHYVVERQKENPLPRNANGINGVPYIRKPACHFGWDWGINLPFSGIIGNIEILIGKSGIKDFDVKQIHKNGTVRLDITVIGEGSTEGEIITPKGETIKLEFIGSKATVLIENPELWWIYELSNAEKQPLYTVKVNSLTKKIGLRTITLNREADEYGNNFHFVLNGVPVFAKGANLIPPNAMADRIKTSDTEKLIYDARLANMNMIRVWGGGYYGSDEFYDMCDEMGILVWQDFMFACLMYPFDDNEFLANVKAEIAYNVSRVKHHPSLALWCGNNEIEFMFAHLPANSKIVQWYKKFFYEILPAELRKIDDSTSYIETSPIGRGFRKNITADNWGDTHMWHVWHGSKNLKYYRKRLTRFCSEYGMESLPSIDCIKTFAPEDELDLYSKTMLYHQKCLSGNSKMFFYLLERYDEPAKFEDLIYFTGLTQMECIRDATEHWRRNKGRCNGSLWWQYNDCWGAPSWSSVDFFGKWKPLMYASKEFNQSFTFSFEDRKKSVAVYLLNDTLEDKNCTLEFGIYDFSGNKINGKSINVSVKANTSKNAVEIPLGGVDKRNCFVTARLSCGEKIIAERTKVLLPERKLNLQQADIKCDVSDNEITLESNTFARQVFVDISGVNIPLTENCFDLLPYKKKTIRLSDSSCINPENVTVKCVNNIECNHSALGRALFRFRFNLKPENIANRIYYSIS